MADQCSISPSLDKQTNKQTWAVTRRVRVPAVIGGLAVWRHYPSHQKVDISGGCFGWVGLALWGHKHIFLRTNKADQKHCENWRCESGSESRRTSPMCERGEWRKHLRDFITQSLKQPPLAPRPLRDFFGLMESKTPKNVNNGFQLRFGPIQSIPLSIIHFPLPSHGGLHFANLKIIWRYFSWIRMGTLELCPLWHIYGERQNSSEDYGSRIFFWSNRWIP